MKPEALAAIISGCGVLVSFGGSAFIAGARWGGVNAKIDQLATQQGNAATKDDMQRSNERLARIEGMFELRIRDGSP